MLQAVARDPAGDLIAAGTRMGTTLTVQRTDELGAEKKWSSEACVGQSGRDVAIDGHGDIVVIGDGEDAGDRNIRLCKFAADGTLKWGKDLDGGHGDDLGFSVAIDAENRIVAAGQMRGEASASDAWLAVFSP